MPDSGLVAMVQEALSACFRCGGGGGGTGGDGGHATSKGSMTDARNRSKEIDRQIKSDQRKQHRQVNSE